MAEKEITAIKAQIHDPDRVSIFLDGEYAFGLSRIIAAWLNIGQRLSEEKIKELSEEDDSEVAYQKALRLLNQRPRTENEIRQRLQKYGFTTDQIDITLQKLREGGLVADRRFAQMWIENRNEFHPRSQRLMRLELKQKGVAVEEIEKALVNSADETELATQAAMRQMRKYSSLEWSEFRKKLSAFLMRRGFSYGTIAPVVRSVWENTHDGQSHSTE